MSTSVVDLTTLAAFFALVTTLMMQGIKLLIELIPGIRLASNKDLHDWVIRIVQYALNFVLLVLAAHTLPSVFAGLYWWDLLSIAFGQGVLSHFTYSVVSQGGSDTVANTAPTVPIPTTFQVNYPTAATATPATSSLPEVPR